MTLEASQLSEPGAPVGKARSTSTVTVSEEDGARRKQDDKQPTQSAKTRAPEERTHETEAPQTHSSGPWLTENIRVRVVSKRVAGGKLYLKKGVVMCMRGRRACDICMDDGGQIQEVRPMILLSKLT